MAGDAQAAALFKEGVKEGVAVKNQITGFRIGQKRGQGGGAAVLGQDGEDESDVFRGELHAAIGLDHCHNGLRSIISSMSRSDFAVSR